MKIIVTRDYELMVQLEHGWMGKYSPIKIMLMYFERDDTIKLTTMFLESLFPDYYQEIRYALLRQASSVDCGMFMLNYDNITHLKSIQEIFDKYLEQQMIIIKLTKS